MSKVFNPSTGRMVTDNTANRNKIEAFAKNELFNIATEANKTKEKSMIDNFWNTFIQPAIVQEKIQKTREKKQRQKNVLTFRAKSQGLETIFQTQQQQRGVLQKYKYVYTVRFYRKGDLTTKRGNMRDGAVAFDEATYQTVNKDEKIIIASRVRLQTKMYFEKQNGEMSEAIESTANDQFARYYSGLIISDPSIIAMAVSKEQPITELRNLRQSTDLILYQTENIAISDKLNYFELDIDRKNKTFTSNATITDATPYACMYNVCMKLGETINDRYITAEYKVTMESIAETCGVMERYKAGDYGLSVSEVLPWFKRYNISLSCYDYLWRQRFHWQKRKEGNKHKLEACSVLIHNGHAFYLSKNAKTSLSLKKQIKIKELPKPTDNYMIKNQPDDTTDDKTDDETDDTTDDKTDDKTKKDKKATKKKKEIVRKEIFKKCNTAYDVFEAIFALEENENLTIYCITEDLMEIVKKMMFEYGITPSVNGKLGQISSIDLILVNNLVRIYTIHNQMLDRDVLEKLTIDEYMLYSKERETLSNIIINNHYKSHYSENIKKAFKHYGRGSLRGLCKNVKKLDDESVFGLDACKSYPTILDSYIEYIPIFSAFDDFAKYTGDEEVHPYYFYIVKKVDEFEGSECIFESDEIMTSGTTVLYLQDKVKVNIDILAVLKPYKIVPNPLCGKLKEVFEKNDYHPSLKKFLVLSIIGLLGKRENTKKKMILSTDKEYIEEICQQYGELGVSSFPMTIQDDEVLDEFEEPKPPLYAFYNEQSITLSSGFYPIQLMIYDLQRITTYKSFKTVSMFTKPLAINTDCVYFKKCEALEQYIKKTYDGSFGSKKLEKEKEVYLFKSVLKPRDSILNSIVKENKQNLISITNEYDLKEIASKLEPWTLITADIAGSGKSYCLQNTLDKKKTLYVTPYNKLAFTLRKKRFNSATFSKLTGCKIAGVIEIERKPLDLTGYDNVVFEEIYSYDLGNLQYLHKFFQKNKTKCFFATGDTFQLESVKATASFEYIDKVIRKLFKNNIHFKRHKRDPKAHDFLVELKQAIFKEENQNNLVDLLRKYFKVVKRDFANEKAVCYFNDTCEIINNQIMMKTRGSNTLRIGDELLCRKRLSTKVGDLIPNYIYNVIKMDGDLITLFEPFDEIKFIVQQHTVHNHFRFQYSETAHSVQGETFDDKITVFDVNDANWCLSPRWCYVALSRSSNIFENVTICVEEIHNNVIQNLDEKIKAYEISDKAKGFEFNERLYPRLNKYSFKALLKQQGGACALCGCKPKLNWSFSQDTQQYSIDRIDNDYVGGHCLQNIQITCLACNVSKK